MEMGVTRRIKSPGIGLLIQLLCGCGGLRSRFGKYFTRQKIVENVFVIPAELCSHTNEGAD